MAKKKTTTTVEEVDETPKDQELDYNKDIKDKSFDQVAEPPKEEEKEEVKEEEKVEEKPEEPAFDQEAFKKEVAEQTKKDLLETLQGNTKQETEENVDHYQKFQEEFFKQNNRQPTWFEVAKDMEEQAVQRLKAERDAEVKAQEQERTKQTEAQTKQNEETNKYIDSTLNELYENEKLPQIEDKKNKDDFGLKTKNALLQKVVEVNSKRIEAGLPAKTLKEVFYEDFELPRKEVAGGNAPTNMGRGGYTPDDTQELDYRDITGPRNTFKNIITGALKRNT